jgi:hypothetical protein
MRLLMESWRTYLLLENIKQDPEQAAELAQKMAAETDQTKVQSVQKQIAADADVKKVMDALAAFFEEAGDEEISEGPLDDAGLALTQAGMGVAAKADEFLQNDPKGQLLAKAAPATLLLAILALPVAGMVGVDLGAVQPVIDDFMQDPRSLQGLAGSFVAMGTKLNAKGLSGVLSQLAQGAVGE